MSLARTASAIAMAAGLLAGSSGVAFAGERYHQHDRVEVNIYNVYPVYPVPPHYHYIFGYNGEHPMVLDEDLHSPYRHFHTAHGEGGCYFTHYNFVCDD